MHIEMLREYCLAKAHVTEGFPFDEDTLVFKVHSKMFCLISLRESNSFNVKCDPELAIALREQHPEVQAGYHMNKKHWNTVFMDGFLSDKQLLEMIDHSYDLVLESIPKSKRQ